MKKNINTIQENYLIAKELWQMAHDLQSEKYNQFLNFKKLTDEIIDDVLTDEERDILEKEYEVFVKNEIEISEQAWNELQFAENALIEFGISIAPANVQKTLREGVKNNYCRKKELIDLVLQMKEENVNKLNKDLCVSLRG